MDEVIAVTGVDADGNAFTKCSLVNNTGAVRPHYGPKVDVAAIIHQPATGSPLSGDGPIARSGGSSNATSIVAGIAALAWSEFPNKSRDEIRNLLYMAAENHGYRTSNLVGYGLINADCAVGGFCDVVISGPNVINAAYADNYTTYEAHPYLCCNFTYEWSTGETTKSATIPTFGHAEPYLIRLWVKVTDPTTGEVIRATKDIYVHYVESCPTCLEEDDPPTGGGGGGLQ